MFEIILRALMAICAAVAFGACSEDSADAQPSPVLSPQAAISPGLSSDDIVELVTADLAARLGVSPSSITLVEFCYVTWPDASLGVAEPGQVYSQALIDGWLAILESDGREYRYHGAAERFIAADFVPEATILDIDCP